MTRQAPVLDTLRAFAVLLVLVDHVLETVSPWHPYDWQLGRLGVLLFFVHTACTLMLSLDRTPLTGWALARHFLVRRAFRLYPLAVVTVALVYLFELPRRPWDLEPTDTSPLAILGNLSLTTNILSVEGVSAGIWTLPVEIQMYLVLPAIFLILQRGVATRLAWLLWAGGLVVGTVFPMGPWLPAFVPCFMAGVIAYTRLSTAHQRIPGWAWLPLLLVTAGGFVALSSLSTEVHSKPATWAACLLVGILVPIVGRVPELIARPAAQVAKYSFGLYLAHPPALLLGFVICGDRLPVIQWAVFLGSLVGAAVAGYHLVESPMIRVGNRVVARWTRPQPRAWAAVTVVALALLVSACTSGGTDTSRRTRGERGPSSTTQRLARATATASLGNGGVPGRTPQLWELIAAGTVGFTGWYGAGRLWLAVRARSRR